MASPKQYKNVYTILEKVKKGEIQSYYKDDDDGLFGKINFYKKEDLIKPYMHYIDERRVDTIVDAYLDRQENIQEAYRKIQASHKIDDDRIETRIILLVLTLDNLKSFCFSLTSIRFSRVLNSFSSSFSNGSSL